MGRGGEPRAKKNIRGSIAQRAALGLALLLPAGAATADGLAPAGTQGKTLKLADVVKLALKNNETARIAELKIDSANGAVESAVGAFLPTVTLGGSALADARQDARGHHLSGQGQLVVRQPILHPSAIPLYRASRYNLDAAKLGAGEDDRSLTFQTAKAFTSVVAAERVVVASQERLDRAKADYEAAQALVDEKINGSNDATRAKLDVSVAVRNLAQAKNGAESARLALDFLIGADIDDPVEPPDDILNTAETYTATPDVLSKIAVSQRNDLKEAHQQTLAARMLAQEPNYRLAPSIDLTGQVSANPDPAPMRPWDDETLALTLTWTIFDGGVRYGDRRSRVAAADTAQETEHKLERSVTKDVQTALTELFSAQAALRAARDAQTAAALNTDETLTLYNQHLARAIELTDANASRFDADVALAQARLDLVNAYLDLLAALGRGPLDSAGGSK